MLPLLVDRFVLSAHGSREVTRPGIVPIQTHAFAADLFRKGLLRRARARVGRPVSRLCEGPAGGSLSGLGPLGRYRAFNQVSSKHVDFVLCDATTFRPVLAVELDD